MSRIPDGGLNHFITNRRSRHECDKLMFRSVYCTDICTKTGQERLCVFFADRLPNFYREPSKIMAAISSGYFLTAVRDTLGRLPSAETFRESHFAEICSAIFAEDVLGLQRLYSKLSLLTSQNANAFKMDLLLVDPNSDPLQFVVGEVKSSPKTEAEGLPANHHKGCFADLFTSFNNYREDDLTFDLAAAKDRVEELPQPLRDRVISALRPYGIRQVNYLGFVVIDSTTAAEGETSLLATRSNKKVFDVELLRVQAFPEVVRHTYGHLEGILRQCSI